MQIFCAETLENFFLADHKVRTYDTKKMILMLVRCKVGRWTDLAEDRVQSLLLALVDNLQIAVPDNYRYLAIVL
jgi:hypothetical protein